MGTKVVLVTTLIVGARTCWTLLGPGERIDVIGDRVQSLRVAMCRIIWRKANSREERKGEDVVVGLGEGLLIILCGGVFPRMGEQWIGL